MTGFVVRHAELVSSLELSIQAMRSLVSKETTSFGMTNMTSRFAFAIPVTNY